MGSRFNDQVWIKYSIWFTIRAHHAIYIAFDTIKASDIIFRTAFSIGNSHLAFVLLSLVTKWSLSRNDQRFFNTICVHSLKDEPTNKAFLIVLKSFSFGLCITHCIEFYPCFSSSFSLVYFNNSISGTVICFNFCGHQRNAIR